MSVLQPKSYDGTDISQASPDYRAKFPRDGAALTPARQQQRVVRVAGFWPRALDPQPQERQFTLLVLVPSVASDAALQAVKTLFSPGKGECPLVATDGTIDWEMDCSVVAVDHVAGLLTAFRVTLQASYGLWKRTTDSIGSVAISAATSATLNLPTVGNERSPAVIEITPTAVKGTASDQRYRRQAIVGWRAARGASRYPLALQLDTATEVTATRMQADGDDLRVLVDGVEVDRWLGTMNAALTNVWIVLDFSPTSSAKVLSAMTSGAPATAGSLALQDGSALPSSGVLVIGTEAIAWTSKSPDGNTLQSITRGVRATTAASHSAGDTGYLVEHQIDVIWGYTAATAPVVDANNQPMPSLLVADSDNTKWTFTQFATKLGTRPAEWVPTLLGTNTGMVALRGGLGAATNYLPASDAGTYNNFTAVGAASRWQCVDDAVGAPNNDTDYIKNATTADRRRQTFPVTITKPPDGSMIGVTLTAIIRSVTTDDIEYGAILMLGGINYEAELYYGDGHPAGAGNPGVITTSYSNKVWSMTISPRSTIAWTADEVAAIAEFGIVLFNRIDFDHRITSLYLSVRAINEDDTANAIGMFVAPGGELQGHPNADAWALATPCGVTGQSAIVASAHLGPSYGAIQKHAAIYGVDLAGQTVLVWQSWSNASLGQQPDTDITISASPGGPLYDVIFWSPAPTATGFAGFSVSDCTLLFDTTQTPLVVLPAREDTYIHRSTITNPATGQSISLLFPSALNKKLTVDADSGAVSYELAGYNPLPAISLDAPRLPWLELAAGANALAWSDPTHGAATATLTAKCRDRRS